jgi:hypothetical protein
LHKRQRRGWQPLWGGKRFPLGALWGAPSKGSWKPCLASHARRNLAMEPTHPRNHAKPQQNRTSTHLAKLSAKRRVALCSGRMQSTGECSGPAVASPTWLSTPPLVSERAAQDRPMGLARQRSRLAQLLCV